MILYIFLEMEHNIFYIYECLLEIRTLSTYSSVHVFQDKIYRSSMKLLDLSLSYTLWYLIEIIYGKTTKHTYINKSVRN